MADGFTCLQGKSTTQQDAAPSAPYSPAHEGQDAEIMDLTRGSPGLATPSARHQMVHCLPCPLQTAVNVTARSQWAAQASALP